MDRKLRVAHFAAFCPNITGQYATVKDMILAERKFGVDARIIPTYVDNEHKPVITENKKDDWLESEAPEWAKKADIIVRHSCVPPEYQNLGIPIIMCLHGRPESTFMIEYSGMMQIYNLISNVKADYRVKGFITFWKEHLFYHRQKGLKENLYYVPAMVDLEKYNPEGVAVNFHKSKGEPNIIIADMWRHDMTPYTMLYAAALFKKKYAPNAKVHIFGVPRKKCDTIISLFKKNGLIANMMHQAKPMENVFRGGDMLITPHTIATRIVRESLACGLPIVAGTKCQFTPYTADPRDIEGFVEQMNRCWQDIQASEDRLKKASRETAEKEFNIDTAGRAILTAFRDVLQKEKDSWKPVGPLMQKTYANYKDYILHQQSKSKYILKSTGEKYQKTYRKALNGRVERLKKEGRLKEGMSVLCLGARDGTEVLAFQDAGLTAIGIDVYPTNKKLVLEGDFQKIQFPDNSFDVLFTNCIDHCYDINGFLDEVIRVLKPDAFFVTDLVSGEIIRPPDRWACLRWNNIIELAGYIRSRGFSVEMTRSFYDGYFTGSICFRSRGGIDRAGIINAYVKRFGLKSYLEIGSNAKETFNRIQCPSKTSVDPEYESDYKMTSDAFFASLNGEMYDAVFIDGLHDAHQVLRDIDNALSHLSPNGYIFLHDCNPKQEYLQIKASERKEDDVWCGDVWKAFAKLRMTRDDLNCHVINRDFGVGVIVRDGQTLFPMNKEIEEMDWEFLEGNRGPLLKVQEPPVWMT